MADKIKKVRAPRQKSNLTATMQTRAKALGIGPRNYLQRLVDEEIKTGFVVKQIKAETDHKLNQLLPLETPPPNPNFVPQTEPEAPTS